MATGLLDVGVAFLVLALGGWTADRVGLSVIPLYVIGGALVGPHVAGAAELPHVPDGEVMELFAELGIVFLLFFLGLEFSFSRLLAAKNRITKAGVVDLAINAPVGLAVGFALGWSLLESVLLAGIVYVSSSAIITKSLIDLGWIADPESEPILGTLVFEDLVIAVYLTVVTPLALGGGGLSETARRVGIAVGFLLALIAVAYLGTRAFDALLSDADAEGLVLRTLGVTIPVAGAALVIGVSEAVAAFFVGMAFSSTDHVDRIEERLTSLRDAFAAVFFFWIGLGTDPLLIASVAGIVLLAVAVTTPTKLLSGYLGGKAFDLSDRRAVRVGAAMTTRGEFSLIIAAIAAGGATDVMTRQIPAVAVGYVLAMSVLGSLLMQYSGGLERLLTRRTAGE